MKKVLAIIFLLVSGVLALAVLVRLPRTIGIAIRTFSGSGYDIGYAVGTLAVVALEIVAIYYMSKYAFKWLRPANVVQTETLDETLIKESRDNNA